MTATATPTSQKVFPDHKLVTHMPFFDGTTLLFCQAGDPVEKTVMSQGSIWKTLRRNPALAAQMNIPPQSQQMRYRPWKLAFCNWRSKKIHSITTGLPGNGIECSPAFYWEADQVHLSFISGRPSSHGLAYRLYTSSGPDLEHLTPPKPLPNGPVFFGFVSPHHICWGAGNTLRLIEKGSGKTFRFKTDFVRVRRVTFLAADPAKLLITGYDNERQHHTVLYDLATGNVFDVSSEGSVYKSSLHEGHLIYAMKPEGGFESRELYHADCTLSPSTIKISQGELYV